MTENTMDARSGYRYKLGTNRLGLWLFILSDAFVFAGLLISRFYLLGDTRPHLDQTLGLIVTSVLLISSFFMSAKVQKEEVVSKDKILSNFIF